MSKTNDKGKGAGRDKAGGYKPLNEGYVPKEKGYSPSAKNPNSKVVSGPKGGSGASTTPSKVSSSSEKAE
jgi:hypothetical protein